MDLISWGFVWSTGWAYARVSRAALAWLAPLLVWMPITSALKLAAAL